MKKIKKVKISSIHPYIHNPRKNDLAVDVVVESIKQCTYVAPIVVDENYEILAGHTRYKALKKLGYDEVDVLIIDNLTDTQKKKYRLLDNKTNEFAQWDEISLAEELKLLDFNGFDFGFNNDIDVDIDSFFEPREEFLEKKIKKIICPYCGGENII